MAKKNNTKLISKDNFINFLASSSPEEINNYIAEKGKPRKLYEAMIFEDNEEETENARTQHRNSAN